MTLEEALESVNVGGSIEQIFWTEHPQSAGVEPEEGMEYRVRVVITKTAENAHTLATHILDQRQKAS